MPCRVIGKEVEETVATIVLVFVKLQMHIDKRLQSQIIIQKVLTKSPCNMQEIANSQEDFIMVEDTFRQKTHHAFPE